MKAGILLVLIPSLASARSVLTERTISTAAALEAARVALEQCRKDGSRVTVTVLDQAARIKVVLSDDGSSPHGRQHSLNKAYTALTYREPSGDYGKRAASTFPASAGPLKLDMITTAAGGLPISAGKDLVGAIGVSGSRGTKETPGDAADARCAQAGIDRIASGLAN